MRSSMMILYVIATLVASAAGDEGTTISIQRNGGTYDSGAFWPGTWDVKTYGESVSVGVPSTAPQGYGLWFTDSGYISRSLYETAAVGSIVPLLCYSASGGQAYLYDILETAGGIRGNATPLSLPMGMSRGSLQAAVPGRHILMLISGNSASNVVILDVGQAGSSAGGVWQPGGSYGSGEGSIRTVNVNIVSTGPGQQTTTETGDGLGLVKSSLNGSSVGHQPGW